LRTYLEKTPSQAMCWWLMPVILASQEAEIKRIKVRGQPRQIVCETLSRRNPTQKRARPSSNSNMEEKQTNK
jgi:hypothetical protein